MNLYYTSDVHTEVNDDWIVSQPLPASMDSPSKNILVLAGNIGSININKDNLYSYLRKSADEFDYILYVPGNSEGVSNGIIRDMCADIGNIMYLKNNVFEMSVSASTCLRVIGCVGWPKLDNNLLVDSNWYGTTAYGRDTPQSINSLHQYDATWITEQFTDETVDDYNVVVTHYPPVRAMAQPHHVNSEKVSAHANQLDKKYPELFYSGYINAWISGHTHQKSNFTIENIKMLSNPFGFTGEKCRDRWSPVDYIHI